MITNITVVCDKLLLLFIPVPCFNCVILFTLLGVVVLDDTFFVTRVNFFSSRNLISIAKEFARQSTLTYCNEFGIADVSSAAQL